MARKVPDVKIPTPMLCFRSRESRDFSLSGWVGQVGSIDLFCTALVSRHFYWERVTLKIPNGIIPLILQIAADGNGKFHNQGDAKWIVIRGQLRVITIRPSGGQPPAGPRILRYKLLLISNIPFNIVPLIMKFTKYLRCRGRGVAPSGCGT
jgi:hypothetical protein